MPDMFLSVPGCADIANITFFTRDSNGDLAVPDSDPIGRIYRINPADGSIAFDVALGASGFLNFANSPAVALTQFWQYPLSLSNAVYNNYFIIITYAVAATEYTIKIDFLLSPDCGSSAGGSNAPSNTPPFISHITT